MTVSEELDLVRQMLRKMCATFSPLPLVIATWWTAEQVKIAQENADHAQQVADLRAQLQTQISDLQAKLDALK